MEDSSDQMKSLMAEMADKFLDMVDQRVTPLVDKPWKELRPEIESLFDTLEKANAWRVKDMLSAGFIMMSSLVLAVYRILLPLFNERYELLDVMRGIIETAFFRVSMDDYLKQRFGISTGETPEQAWEHVCVNFLKLGNEQFGASWIYEQGCKDARRCFVNVRKCGFYEFFRDNGAIDLLQCFCVMDYLWGDALEKYGIKMVRPTILAEGSEACRFQFFKMTD